MTIKKEEFPEGYKHLFTTIVGSHAWCMNHAESDIDIFVCYAAPSVDFLLGQTHIKGHQSCIGSVDRTSMEIGKVVNQVLKNNINYLLCVLSQKVEFSTPEFDKLVNLTYMNLHKGCYRSINGYTHDEFTNKIETGKMDIQKTRRRILRTLNFGITLLENGIVEFTPVLHYVEIEELRNAFDSLDIAYENTILPEEPMHRNEMMDWLLNIRMQNLREL